MAKINLIIIGNAGAGKTSLVQSYKSMEVNKNGTQKVNGNQDIKITHIYDPNIGVKFDQKIVPVGDREVKVQMWDTAGQETYYSLTKQYFKRADGVVIVFDLTDISSFKKAQDFWIDEVKDKTEEKVKSILIGNKVDLKDERQVRAQDAVELANKYEMKYFETSAHTLEQVSEAFFHLTKITLQEVDQDIDNNIIDPSQFEKKQTTSDKIKSFFTSCFK